MNVKKPIVNLILLNEAWTKIDPSWKEEISYAFEKAAETLDKDFSESEVSVVLADDTELQSLNQTYRHKNTPTNVLSFPSEEEGELGDIILSLETILKEAEEREIPPLHHTLHLIIHGFLHLLGYDHEEEHEAQKMENMETNILNRLNICNPYED